MLPVSIAGGVYQPLFAVCGMPSLTPGAFMCRQGSAPGADKRLARALKMCSFYLKLAVGLSESYIACVGGALASLVRLVFTLIRLGGRGGTGCGLGEDS